MFNMKIGFCTDLHLDHSNRVNRDVLISNLYNEALDVLLIGGDIGTAQRFEHWMHCVEGIAQRTYFVLGNHDFYGASIYPMMRRVSRLYPKEYLTARSLPVELNKDTCVIGEDCWGDCSIGNPCSRIEMTDHFCIADFEVRIEPISKIRKNLGRLVALRLKSKIETAIAMKYQKIYILTHVPLFAETSLYRGKPSNEEYAPFYVCGQAGEMLRSYKEPEMVVLSGHSHYAADVRISSNIRCIVAQAVYGAPIIYKTWKEENYW